MTIDTSAKPEMEFGGFSRLLVSVAIKAAHKDTNDALMLTDADTETARHLREASELLTRAAIANMEGR